MIQFGTSLWEGRAWLPEVRRARSGSAAASRNASSCDVLVRVLASADCSAASSLQFGDHVWSDSKRLIHPVVLPEMWYTVNCIPTLLERCSTVTCSSVACTALQSSTTACQLISSTYVHHCVQQSHQVRHKQFWCSAAGGDYCCHAHLACSEGVPSLSAPSASPSSSASSPPSAPSTAASNAEAAPLAPEGADLIEV